MKNTLLTIVGLIACLVIRGTALAAPVTTETISPTPTIVEEYVLPYPGVMPNNPLYFLKGIRDRIMEWLITDPARKIDFYVLQSDKNLNAGILLTLGNNKPVAVNVLGQSLQDIKKAITLTSTSTLGKDMKEGLKSRIGKSLNKHQQVITELAGKAEDSQKGTFEGYLNSITKLQGEVAGLQ